MRNSIEKWIVENAQTVWEGIYLGLKSAFYIAVTTGLMYLFLIICGYEVHN
jgi:hypothetical protein